MKKLLTRKKATKPSGRQTAQEMERKVNTKTEKFSNVTVAMGSENIFADLGFSNANEHLLKAKLAIMIAEVIEKKGWTHAQTAERTALEQLKVSRLLRGQLSGFSADRLFAVLNRLGHSVEVRISAKEQAPEKSHTCVMIA